jgi:RNA polymerase sigma factor (sigma-70 family)
MCGTAFGKTNNRNHCHRAPTGAATDEEHTTAAVQRYLDELAGDSPSEPVIRALLDRAVRRLHQLCATVLYRSYPRLTRPPLNLQADEMLGAVVARLIKALRQVRPATARQFFALACQHMRWELNDVARRFDEQPRAEELREESVPAPASSASGLTPDGRRILAAIDQLPDGERKAFDLVRIQGMSQSEAARVLEVSVMTVNRRLNRGLQLLAAALADLYPGGAGEVSSDGSVLAARSRNAATAFRSRSKSPATKA